MGADGWGSGEGSREQGRGAESRRTRSRVKGKIMMTKSFIKRYTLIERASERFKFFFLKKVKGAFFAKYPVNCAQEVDQAGSSERDKEVYNTSIMVDETMWSGGI